jgi:hypothetical protein
MPTNTATLKTFAQQTRAKLISLITTKLQFVLGQDTAELRGHEKEIDILRKEIQSKGEENVIEEVAYTWFNRVMALRYMDANGYDTPMIVSPATGQTRPEILQDAMGGTFDEELHLSNEDKLLPEAKLYRRLLVAICNQRYAEMPFLFERISDYTELLLPDDLLSDQSFVSDIRNGMTGEDCQNVELLGWLYQFYITDRKADAEVKKTKKGGLKSDEQAAATQLFTPHWVVRYMVENSLGRIWMTLHPNSPLIKEMPYYIPTPEGQTDTIPEDIKSVEDIRFIDPCMGSGHILVYAFDLFTKMYEEEGYQTREIPTLILTNNIFGIDIDRRCYQLASFALTMKARAYYSRYLRKAVQPHTIALQNIDHDTIASAGNWDAKSSMWQFENVDTIGSLLQITADDCNKIKIGDGLFGVQQQLLKTQAEYLSRKYHCVVTNPPYLGKGMGDILKNYVLSHYPNSKSDTMATFMERAFDFCICNGKIAMINMQSWMFLSSYEKLRSNLLENYQIDSLLHLGPHAFDEIGGEVVQCATFTVANHKPTANGGIYYRLVDGGNSAEKESSFLHRENEYTDVSQSDYERIPGSPIGYWVSDVFAYTFKNRTLDSSTTIRQGLATGDNVRFIRLWFEISNVSFEKCCTSIEEANKLNIKWMPFNKGGSPRKWSGNYDYVIAFDRDNICALSKMGNHLPSQKLYFKKALTWSALASSSFAIREHIAGSIFSNAGMVCITPPNLYDYIMGFTNSKAVSSILKLLSPTINFNAGDIKRMPLKIDEEKKTFVDGIVNQNIKISRTDWDAHETSWDFRTNELLTINESNWLDILNDYSLQAGICIDPAPADTASFEWRMSMYKMKWEAKFLQLHSNEEELNRQFIEIYGLQDELTPEVPLNEITILQKGEISIENNEIVWHEDNIIKQLISYLVGCFMGRYSIDKPGLIIASQHQNLNEIGLKVEGIETGAPGRLTIDDDGIVPIVEEEDFFADDMTMRIEQAIKIIFGEANHQDNLKYINEKLGGPLREYLFKDFYNDHIDGKMYQKRPIYWLFSSKMGEKKKKGYFKALVYMHRLESDTLSKLHADYVHPYLNKLELQLREAEEQTLRDDLSTTQHNKALKAADEMRDKVREVHAFEQQLVELASHRISIDLDDGVKTNYPKFYPLVEPIKGLESNDD